MAQRNMLSGALNRMRNYQLSRAWERWQEWYEDYVAQKERYALLVGGALNRMRNLALSRAWEQWQAWYTDVKHQVFLLSGALNRMRNFHLSRGWEQWQYWYADYVTQKERYQWLVGGALNRMRNFQLSRAWERWQQWYWEKRNKPDFLTTALKHMTNLQLARHPLPERMSIEQQLVLSLLTILCPFVEPLTQFPVSDP